MPSAGLLGPPPHPRRTGSRRPGCPAGRLVRDFKQAWEDQDIDALIGLLDPGATVIADGGGLAPAALRPIEGAAQIARYVVDLAARAPGNVTILERTVNGQPGLVAQQDGVTVTVFAFGLAGDRIKRYLVLFVYFVQHMLDPVAREAEREHRDRDAVLLGDQAGLAVDRTLQDRHVRVPGG